MAKRKKKQRKSKAQQEYERVRARLLRARARGEKEGSKYYFDLAPTPKQLERQRGDKATAKVYREAANGLKAFEKVYKGVRKRERAAERLPLLDMSLGVINSFLAGLDLPTAYGGHLIIEKTWKFVCDYDETKVALAITEMQEANDLVGTPEFYNVEYAKAYMARMSLRLRRLNKISPDEMIKLEDKLMGNAEIVPDEVAQEYFNNSRMHSDIDELIEKYEL